MKGESFVVLIIISFMQQLFVVQSTSLTDNPNQCPDKHIRNDCRVTKEKQDAINQALAQNALKHDDKKNETDVHSIYSIVGKYLGEPWVKVGFDQIKIKKIVNSYKGITDYLFELPSTVQHNYTKVFVKSAKPFERSGSELLITEIIAAQIGIGVKVLGYFDNGIIEQYFGERDFNKDDFTNRELLEQVAIKLAQFHRIKDIPVTNNGYEMKFILQDDQKLISNILKCISDVKARESIVCTLNSIDYFHEKQSIKNIITKFPIVFVHGDLSVNNIRVKGNSHSEIVNESHEIRFINFDNSGYAFRGIDFSEFFLNWQNTDTEQYHLDEEEMSFFLSKYRQENIKMNAHWGKQDINSLENLIIETKFFMLSAYLRVIYEYSVVNAARENEENRRSLILEMASKEICEYFKIKNEIHWKE